MHNELNLRVKGNWPSNEVEALLLRIKEIQGGCAHTFELAENLDLRSTDKKGMVFNGSLGSSGDGPWFEVKCARCSKVEQRTFEDTCPCCIGPMGHKASGDREVYYNNDDSRVYYGCHLFVCPTCGLQVVVDYYDR